MPGDANPNRPSWPLALLTKVLLVVMYFSTATAMARPSSITFTSTFISELTIGAGVGHATLETVIGAMLAALWNEFTKLHREMLKIARGGKIFRRLMSTPGVGALMP